MLRKSKLLAIDARGRILLVRNRRTKRYNFPGGRAFKGETSIRTLRREIRQELPRVTLSGVRRWRNPPRFKLKKTVFYFATAKGPLKTGNEIDRAVRTRRGEKIKISIATRKTLEILATRGYLW